MIDYMTIPEMQAKMRSLEAQIDRLTLDLEMERRAREKALAELDDARKALGEWQGEATHLYAELYRTKELLAIRERQLGIGQATTP